MTFGSREALSAWLVAAVARELHMREEALDPARPLAFYGLDSLAAAGLAGDLEDELGHPLPADLLREHSSIASIADYLTSADWRAPAAPADRQPVDGPPAVAGSPGESVVTPGTQYARWNRTQLLLRGTVAGLVRATSRVDVEGHSHLPADGPVLIACNHLHILDACWVPAVLPRRVVFLAAGEFEYRFVVGAYLRAVGSIFVARGRADRDALDRAVAAVRDGAALVVAPEGKLSRTGGLIQGQTGLAYVATEAGVPIVPVVAFGQERAGRCWRRLRRVPVHIRIGAPFVVPHGRATARELQTYTERIMSALSALLPPAYRGVYGTR